MTRVVATPKVPLVQPARAHPLRPVDLVQISLPAYDTYPALTLRAASRALVDSDGTQWPGTLKSLDAIEADGGVLSSSWSPVEARFSLMDMTVVGADGASVSDLLHRYEWVGAEVTIYATDYDNPAADDFTIQFKGTVASYEAKAAPVVTVRCVQPRGWTIPVPPTIVTETNYPSAPIASRGLRLPWVFGNFIDHRGRIVMGSDLFNAHLFGLAWGGAKCVPVKDSDTVSGESEYLLAAHGLYAIEQALYVPEGGADGNLSRTNYTPAVASTNPYTLRRTYRQMEVAIRPVDLHADSNAVSKAVLVAEERDLKPMTYATVNGSNPKLYLLFPDTGTLGEFVAATAWILWEPMGAIATSKLKFRYNFAGGGLGTTEQWLTASSASGPELSALNVGPTATGGSNAIQKWEDLVSGIIEVEAVDTGLAVDAKVYAASVLVVYKPKGRLVQPGRVRKEEVGRVSVTGRRDQWVPSPGRARFGWYRDVTDADIYKFDDTGAVFFGYGLKDDADGTYSGTAGALIQNPADVLSWMLDQSPSVPRETAGSTFGSFIDARTALSSMKMRAHITEGNGRDEAIEAIAQEFMLWLFRSQHHEDARMLLVQWKRGQAANYLYNGDPFRLTSGDLSFDETTASRMNDSWVVNDLTVKFDHDPSTNKYRRSLLLGPDATSVYDGGAWTTDTSRQSKAVASEALFGRRSKTVNLKYAGDETTATALARQYFDWHVMPPVTFESVALTFGRDLERGHIFAMDRSIDNITVFPLPGTDGSWENRKFMVTEVSRFTSTPLSYRFKAVEV